MMHARKLRMLGFGIVTIAGAFHLSTARAATVRSTVDCDSYASGYAAGYCAAQGKQVSRYEYTCDKSNTVAIDIIVTCQ